MIEQFIIISSCFIYVLTIVLYHLDSSDDYVLPFLFLMTQNISIINKTIATRVRPHHSVRNSYKDTYTGRNQTEVTKTTLFYRNSNNCSMYFTATECKNGNDPRVKYIDRYRSKNNSMLFLLVVNHHWNAFSTVRFFRETYLPRFHELFRYNFDVVYLTPTNESSRRIISHKQKKGGWYSYYTLVVAYHLYGNLTNYDGYFLLNDDAALDPLYLNEYDLTTSFSEPSRVWDSKTNWSWNLRKNHNHIPFPKAMKDAIKEIRENPTLEEKCHLKNESNIRRGLHDFFYVAKQDIEVFTRLATIFYNHRSFLETAAPTITWCLNHRFIIDCNHFHWRKVETCVHMHPIKYRSQNNKKLVMDHINRVNIHRVPSMSW